MGDMGFNVPPLMCACTELEERVNQHDHMWLVVLPTTVAFIHTTVVVETSVVLFTYKYKLRLFEIFLGYYVHHHHFLLLNHLCFYFIILNMASIAYGYIIFKYLNDSKFCRFIISNPNVYIGIHPSNDIRIWRRGIKEQHLKIFVKMSTLDDNNEAKENCSTKRPFDFYLQCFYRKHFYCLGN